MPTTPLNSNSSAFINPSNNALQINIVNSDQTAEVDNSQAILSQPHTESVELLESPVNKNGESGLEGELLMEINDPDILLFVDDDGDFYLTEEQSAYYDINANGELIFNQIVDGQ